MKEVFVTEINSVISWCSNSENCFLKIPDKLISKLEWKEGDRVELKEVVTFDDDGSKIVSLFLINLSKEKYNDGDDNDSK